MRQPCEVCGIDKVDAHHEDYNDAMNIMWLCREHHIAHHAKLKQMKKEP